LDNFSIALQVLYLPFDSVDGLSNDGLALKSRQNSRNVNLRTRLKPLSFLFFNPFAFLLILVSLRTLWQPASASLSVNQPRIVEPDTRAQPCRPLRASPAQLTRQAHRHVKAHSRTALSRKFRNEMKTKRKSGTANSNTPKQQNSQTAVRVLSRLLSRCGARDASFCERIESKHAI
jgi:hypothetical protein